MPTIPANKTKQAEYSHRHYMKNRVMVLAKRKRRYKEIRVKIVSHKKQPCMDCGVEYPSYVMDLDHRRGVKKLIVPAEICRMGWSDTKIETELAKCDVVCANCHRIRTFSE